MEHEAAWRFHALAEDLDAHGALPTVVAMARAAAEDERRHVQLCEGLAVHFGDVPMSPSPPRAKPSADKERLLLDVVAVSCITETLSAAVLGELVERAQDERVRAVVHEILTDEVQHARVGWAHLAAQKAPLGFVSAHLPAILEGTVDAELFEPAPSEGLAGVGSLDRSVRLDLFIQTLEAVIFPGFEHHGIDTSEARAWLHARRKG